MSDNVEFVDGREKFEGRTFSVQFNFDNQKIIVSAICKNGWISDGENIYFPLPEKKNASDDEYVNLIKSLIKEEYIEYIYSTDLAFA